MFEVDRYLGLRFDLHHYNCWHFVRDVWFELTGDKLHDYTPVNTARTDLWRAAFDAQCCFQEVKNVVVYTSPPLIVLMQRAKDTPHIGVLYQGKVLHLRPEGVIYSTFEVATVGFSKVQFYTTRSKS